MLDTIKNLAPPDIGLGYAELDNHFHTQIPMQSAPPFLGSQSSPGRSTHFMSVGHRKPAKPPHCLTQIPG